MLLCWLHGFQTSPAGCVIPIAKRLSVKQHPSIVKALQNPSD
jgi:hypothetical protein